MKIDKIDIVRSANDMEKIIMDVYDQKARYMFLTSDGNEYSTNFDEKSLAEFCPSQTVKGFMKATQENFIKRIAHYKKCLETNEHVYGWTVQRKILHPITQTPTGKTEEVPETMTESMRAWVEKEIIKLEGIKGELKFVKIVPFDFIMNEPCAIWANNSMNNISQVKLVSETNTHVFYKGIYDSYKNAPSQDAVKEGSFLKADIGLIQYYKFLYNNGKIVTP